MKLATSELKQGPPLMILLQDILRVPDRAIRDVPLQKALRQLHLLVCLRSVQIAMHDGFSCCTF